MDQKEIIVDISTYLKPITKNDEGNNKMKKSVLLKLSYQLNQWHSNFQQDFLKKMTTDVKNPLED